MEETEEAQPSKVKKSIPWMLLFVVLNLTALSAGVYLTYLGVSPHNIQPATEESIWAELQDESFFQVGEPILLAMEPLTLNLESPGYVLSLEVNFELSSEASFDEIMRKRPLARDTVLGLLHKKSYQDVESLQGKLKLKDQILRAVNSLLDEGVVRDVFFSQFVVEVR